MRNILTLTAIFQFLNLIAAGQGMDKIRKDFEDKLRDTTVQYGHDKSRGKFYNIRGFKMYAEVYGQGAPQSNRGRRKILLNGHTDPAQIYLLCVSVILWQSIINATEAQRHRFF